MSDVNNTPETQEPQNQEPAKAPETQEPTSKEHMIPKSRFDEINSKYKEMQTKLDELMGEREKSEKKTKEQQGKFEELYKNANTELETTKNNFKETSTRVQQLETVINGLLEAKLENIPEEFHDLIPGNLPPEAKLDWLAAAERKGLFGSKKEQPIGESTNPAGSQTTDLNTLSPSQLLRAAYGSK